MAPQKVNHFAILQFFSQILIIFSLLIILSFNDHSPISLFSDFEIFSLMIRILLLVMQGKTKERENEGNSGETTQDKSTHNETCKGK